MKKLREARDSFDGRQKVAEIGKALVGLPVDWTLTFSSARRDDDDKTMRVYLYPLDLDTIVFTELPLAGNEQLPLTEKGDVFRLRGKISNADLLAIEVTDATLEYVSSKKQK